MGTEETNMQRAYRVAGELLASPIGAELEWLTVIAHRSGSEPRIDIGKYEQGNNTIADWVGVLGSAQVQRGAWCHADGHEYDVRTVADYFHGVLVETLEYRPTDSFAVDAARKLACPLADLVISTDDDGRRYAWAGPGELLDGQETVTEGVEVG